VPESVLESVLEELEQPARPTTNDEVSASVHGRRNAQVATVSLQAWGMIAAREPSRKA
jgi:hypothetical protein